MQTNLNDLGQPVIQLTQDDYKNCINVVEQKKLSVEKRKSKTTYDQTSLMTDATEFCGALGEQAVSNYFNCLYVYMSYDPNASDVLGYQVRTTYYENGHLLTHASDDKHYGDKPGRYILVTIDQKTLTATIRGYSTLTRCNERTNNYETGWRYPCFAMPQDQLWPIDMLPATDELVAHQLSMVAA